MNRNNYILKKKNEVEENRIKKREKEKFKLSKREDYMQWEKKYKSNNH